MSFVRRYKNMNTDLDDVYKDVIDEFQGMEELNIVNELEGEANGKPFKSVTAVRGNIPRVFVGALREVTMSITGDPNDFIVELHTGAWFSNLAMPGMGGFIIAGPIGGLVGAGASGIVAVDYQMKMSKRLREIVDEHSKEDLTIDKEEIFHTTA